MKYDMTEPPEEGIPVKIYCVGGCEVAYFCDGEFYNLRLDPRLGILRKEHVDKKVLCWEYIL